MYNTLCVVYEWRELGIYMPYERRRSLNSVTRTLLALTEFVTLGSWSLPSFLSFFWNHSPASLAISTIFGCRVPLGSRHCFLKRVFLTEVMEPVQRLGVGFTKHAKLWIWSEVQSHLNPIITLKHNPYHIILRWNQNPITIIISLTQSFVVRDSFTAVWSNCHRSKWQITDGWKWVGGDNVKTYKEIPRLITTMSGIAFEKLYVYMYLHLYLW